MEHGGVTNKCFTSAELFYNTADNGRLGSQHFRATCFFFFFFFLFSRAKSLGRRLSNGRQIATRCVADTRTSVRRNPTLFMTATVTAKPSQAAVLGESDCTRGTLNVACFWYHSRAALLINTFPYHKLYYAITVLRRGSSISTHGIQLTAGVFFETWVTKMRTWLLPWERL